MKKVAVICRGTSLDYIDELPEMDLYILVNRFGHELEVPKVKKTLEGKEIYHVMSRVGPEPLLMIERGHYKKFDIKKMIQPYTKHMGNPNSGNSYLFKEIDGERFFFGGKQIPAFLLGDHHIEHMHSYQSRYPHHYPSSGNAGFAYGTIDTDATDVYLIGMDFYENTNKFYYADDPASGFSPEDCARMKESILNIVSKFPEKNFTIYTCGNVETDLENCKVIQVGR